MSAISYELYIDESGNFKDTSWYNKSNGIAPSLVGGLICPSRAITAEFFNEMPDYIHATEGYKKDEYFGLLRAMKTIGGRFVIFENSERIKVVDGDTTYLNIICEGIVKLLKQLAVNHHDDEVQLNILVALRTNVGLKEATHGEVIDFLHDEEYIQRLEERLIIAMGKNQVKGVSYSIKFANAKKDKRLMLADVICNTYFTQKKYLSTGEAKFSQAEKEEISRLYEDAYIFPVFENATVGYINRLFIEGRYEEMMFQICALNKLSGVTKLKNMSVKRISKLSYNEQKTLFSYMSLQIRQFNSRRLFEPGIQFAENYKRYFLEPLKEFCGGKYTNLGQELTYWTFDTNFYILTMYDHLGNVAKCNEYLELCRTDINSICSSWEHIDYYFQFKIRELNCMLGQFRFEEVIEKANQLISVLKDAKDVFGMIGTYEDTEIETSSELLGKVNGVKLEALINLLHINPELFEEAVETSDAAIDEFERPQDLQRQWQYRSMLMVEAGKPEEAIECLLKSANISINEKAPFEKFISIAMGAQRVEVFSLSHYTNVLLHLFKKKDTHSGEMANALFGCREFTDALNDEKNTGHPWNLVLWNVSQICKMKGQTKVAEELFKKAVTISKSNPENLTMYSFALSMMAKHIIDNPETASKDMKEYMTIYKKINIPSTPQSILQQFPEGTKNETLLMISTAYLK